MSYAASDAAGQLIFFLVTSYILKFYTDVVGLAPAIAGTILLIARLTDAIDAPIWGIIFEKTNSRWGKSRPWFLWLCFPFALFGVLTFLAPDLSPTAKMLYSAGCYITCSIIYTGINTPVTSILSALTPDPEERVVLTCFRMFGSKLGVLLVNLTAMWLVAYFGQGDDKRGYMLTVPIFAAASMVLFLLAFFNLKEQIPVEKEKPLPVKIAFSAMKGNWPWIIIATSSLFFWVAFIARYTMVPFVCEYTLHSENFTAAKLTTIAFSLDIVSLVSIFTMPWLCRWASKTAVWGWALLASALCQGVIYAGVANNSLPLVLTGWIIGILTSGIALAMPFSLLSDSVDYGEWKTGVRAAGLLTAIGAAFVLKAGSGLGGALPAWILGATGYVPNVQQSASALWGIEVGFIWLPAAFYLLSAIPVFFYRKYERMEPEIHAELEVRRAGILTTVS